VEPVTTGKRTCRAFTRAGDPCRAAATTSGLCVFHDADVQRSAAVRGGHASSLKNRAYRRLPEPLSSLLDTLQLAVSEVHDGRITPSQGQAIASLVSVIVKSLELADYAKRLDALEAALLKDNKR